MSQPVDLHSHSYFSDGVLSPEELTELMHSKGVKLFSLTDHDTVEGCARAAKTAADLGLDFLPGVEVSTIIHDKSIHVLGLNIDTQNEDLLDFLAEIRELRKNRFEQILARLDHFNIHVRDHLQLGEHEVSLGRLHIADAIVAAGHAENRGEAFRKYLLKGGAAYFPCPWPKLERTIKIIHQAGGTAVLAHPGSYGCSLPELRGLFRQFRDAGGDGAEVSSGPSALGMVQRLSQLCTKFGLLVSAGSDFHDPSSKWVKAGEYQQIPSRLTRIWQEKSWLVNA